MVTWPHEWVQVFSFFILSLTYLFLNFIVYTL
jgi:hypothetical protein